MEKIIVDENSSQSQPEQEYANSIVEAGHLVTDTTNCGRETAEAVNDAFMEAGVVSPSPTVTLSVQETPLPIGYRAQALAELGCSSDETMDYLIDQFETKLDISGEAAREVDEQNVRVARHALK